MKVGLRREDALCSSKWSVDVDKIAAGLRWIWPPSLVGGTTKTLSISFSLSLSSSICH